MGTDSKLHLRLRPMLVMTVLDKLMRRGESHMHLLVSRLIETRDPAADMLDILRQWRDTLLGKEERSE